MDIHPQRWISTHGHGHSPPAVFYIRLKLFWYIAIAWRMGGLKLYNLQETQLTEKIQNNRCHTIELYVVVNSALIRWPMIKPLEILSTCQESLFMVKSAGKWLINRCFILGMVGAIQVYETSLTHLLHSASCVLH